MKELCVEIVVEGVEVRPPCVVVRVQWSIEQQYGRQSQLAFHTQPQLVPDCLVQQNHTHHSTRPHDQRVVVHTEVNVMVSGFVRLVRSCDLHTVYCHSCNPVLYRASTHHNTVASPVFGSRRHDDTMKLGRVLDEPAGQALTKHTSNTYQTGLSTQTVMT